MKHYLAPLYGVREYECGRHGFRNVIKIEVAVLSITSEVQAVLLVLKAAVAVLQTLQILAEVKLALEIVNAYDGNKKKVKDHDEAHVQNGGDGNHQGLNAGPQTLVSGYCSQWSKYLD